MNARITSEPLLQSAFRIARSGAVTRASDIRKHLQKEGFTYAEIGTELAGTHVRRQLNAAISAAKQHRHG